MMIVSVRWAWRIVGGLKMGTPLLTASTPVIAVHPLAKARIEEPDAHGLGRGREHGGRRDRQRVPAAPWRP